jgi:cytosine deaminase
MRVDLRGALVIAPFVDAHVHLDKTLIGEKWRPHLRGSSVRDRIRLEREARPQLTTSMAARASALIDQVLRTGTGHLRSHVDIDSDVGLSYLEQLLEVRATYRGIVSVELVAFPQSGIVSEPGSRQLLEAALRSGAEVIGGLDPIGFDNDLAGHLNVVFDLAERFGAKVDVHLHDPGGLGLSEVLEITARTEALGLAGRVVISHAYCLGMVSGSDLSKAVDALARAEVAIMTNGPAGPMPPVKLLKEAGVTVFAGSDNIRDTWWPFGNGDQLERATAVAFQSGWRTDEDLRSALELVTSAPAKILSLDSYGIVPGNRADFVIVDAESTTEAVAGHSPRLLVWVNGSPVGTNAISEYK